ncbi:MAG: UDP-N-acetylmuramate dehydrogenase [Candidatus Tagabacteria bacterium]
MPNIQKNILLAPYTAFKIGGPAKYFSEAKNSEEIKEVCKYAKEKELPILVLGGGSNVLISDKGFNGLVIKVQSSKFKVQSSKIIAEAGMPLAKLVAEATKNNLTGLEWAIGIPGTIGGAINGNSGAFGKSMSERLEEANVFDIADSKIKIFKNNDCKFSYRNSIFKHNQNLIILSAILRLKKGEKEKMQNLLKDYAKQRIESNPIGYSAGCFFKNIEWQEVGDKAELIKKFPELNKFNDKPKISVGFLIEQAGLKGKKIGGAVVSEKHAAFIINSGKAAADDVINLSNLIKQKVSERYGLNLEEETVIV